MKTSLLIIFFLLVQQTGFSQNFIIDEKGIVKCPTAKVGDIGTINGEIYEAVDRELLIKRKNQNADLSKVCTSLVSDMSSMFTGTEFNQPIGNCESFPYRATVDV